MAGDEYTQVLKKYHWDTGKTKNPQVNININFTPEILEKKPVFGISCDIPEHIFNMKDQNEKNAALNEWVLQLLAYVYNIPKDYFAFDISGNKDKFINTTTFNWMKILSIFLIQSLHILNSIMSRWVTQRELRFSTREQALKQV